MRVLASAMTAFFLFFAPELKANRLKDWLKRTAPLTLKEQNSAQQFSYIFVAGFLNEAIPHYFTDNIATLKKNGVPEDSILTIYPPSSVRLEPNAEMIRTALVDLYNKNSKPQVVVAHSRACIESLLAALQFHTDLSDVVHRWILIQGPMKGSPVVDYMVEHPEVILPDERMPFLQRICLNASFQIRKLLSYKIEDGLQGMLTENIEKTLKLHAREDSIANLSPKIWYITSATNPEIMADAIRCTGFYLNAYYGPNDGLVPKDNQSLVWIGNVLTHLDADHATLTNKWPVSNKETNIRVNFTTNLLRFIASK